MEQMEHTRDSLPKLDRLKQTAVRLATKTNCGETDLRALVYVAPKWNGTRQFGQSCEFCVPDVWLSTKLSALPTCYIPIETNSLGNGEKSNRVLWIIFVEASDPSGLTYGDIFHAVDEWNTCHCCSLGDRVLLERVTVNGLEVKVGLAGPF